MAHSEQLTQVLKAIADNGGSITAHEFQRLTNGLYSSKDSAKNMRSRMAREFGCIELRVCLTPIGKERLCKAIGF